MTQRRLINLWSEIRHFPVRLKWIKDFLEEQQLKDFKAPPPAHKAGLLAINIREKLLGERSSS
jgi:hypothetical protein